MVRLAGLQRWLCPERLRWRRGPRGGDHLCGGRGLDADVVGLGAFAEAWLAGWGDRRGGFFSKGGNFCGEEEKQGCPSGWPI